MVRPELPTRSIDEAVAALGKAPFEAWCAVEMPSVATTSMRLSVQTRGDAHELFWNDPVQILRGCLLVSRFGCAIEPETLQMMTSHKVRLAHEPAERVGKAVEDLLYGSFVHDALTETVDVLVAALPEVAACRNFDQHTPYHIYDVWEHIAWVVQYSPATPLARWAALLHDIGKPAACFMEGKRAHFKGHARLSVALARNVMERFRVEPPLAEQIILLVKMHDTAIEATPEGVLSAIEKLGGDTELFRSLCILKRADALAHSDLAIPRLRLSYDLERVLDELIAKR